MLQGLAPKINKNLRLKPKPKDSVKIAGTGVAIYKPNPVTLRGINVPFEHQGIHVGRKVINLLKLYQRTQK